MYPPPPTAPNPYAPQLRPLGIGETLDAAIKIFIRNFKALVICAAVVVVPLQILAAFVRLSALTDATTTTTTSGATTTTVDTGALGLQLAALLVTTAVLFLAQFLATAVCMKASSDAYLGQKASASSSLRFAARRLPSLLLLGLLVWVPIYIGLGLCLAPGLWLLASWAVAVPALLIEGARGTKAIGRSWALVRGRRWPILGVLLLAYLLSSVLSSILGVGVLGASGFDTNSATYVVLSTISSVITTSLTVPVYATIVALIYFDL
ncbi:MAG TPA: glycerophosphoryl diester phosphodiesterase membrane domain-containing protein, partial [Acidimicrobiia bacterium]|nr:glycerophosphoryl diester phosphodiesterase membrane domain-containing protein [Acidimicrobiia bacterium]